jgi:hypothetical protein
VRTLRPGERPQSRLADVLEGGIDEPVSMLDRLLARHAPSASLLLVVDQLEELFAVASAEERLGFVAAVRMLRADSRCVLVFTLRADFYGAFMESALWSDLDGRISRIEIGALRGDSLRMVIERPARDVGVYFQSVLVARLLGDAAREPGALPLLQEALVQLWGQRRRRLLVLANYEALGTGDGSRTGLAFAISEHADVVLRRLTRLQEAIALRILLRLVTFGEGRADTRRQQPRAALRSESETVPNFDAVLRHLVDNRLLTVTGDDQHADVRVDLAHEVLIDAWQTFADWIRAWRDHEQRRRELEAAAAAWRRRGGRQGGLLDADELGNAMVWCTAAAQRLGHSADVAAFLAASAAAQARSSANRSRRRSIAAALVALFMVGTFSVMRIIIERNRADHSAFKASAAEHKAVLNAEELTLAQARSNVETNPTRAVAMLKPLAAKYWREARAIAAAARAAGVAWGIPVSKHTLSLEMSHDGLYALSAGNDGVIRLHDLIGHTTRSIAELGTRLDTLVMARFADGERQIVTWHDAQLAIFDARTGARRDLTAGHRIAELDVVGATVYWVDDHGDLWKLDLAGAGPEQVSLGAPMKGFAASPGGRWIAVAGDDHLYLYDRTQATPSLLQVLQGTTEQLAWSDDGEDLVALVVQPPSGQQVFGVTMSPQPRITIARWSTSASSSPRLLATSTPSATTASRSWRATIPSSRPRWLAAGSSAGRRSASPSQAEATSCRVRPVGSR